MNCRREAAKEKNLAEYVCQYCGMVADTIDHVPPTSIRQALVELKLQFQYPFITVRACRECNTTLNDEAYWTIDQRKEYLRKKYLTKYHRYLQIPEWNPRDLETLAPALREMTRHGIAVRDLMRKRLETLGNIVLPNLFDALESEYDDSTKARKPTTCPACHLKLRYEGLLYCSNACEYVLGGDVKVTRQEIKTLFKRLSAAQRITLRIYRLERRSP